MLWGRKKIIMKNKSQKYMLIAAILFLVFVAFTFVVTHIDVRAIGPQQSSVGLASLNQWVFDFLGVNLLWYEITGWLGAIVMLFPLGFAVLGAYQLFKRKSLRKVDEDVLLLGGFYVVIAAVYLFFEQVVVNYRPIILETALEASYPSSHTMMVISVAMTTILQFHRLFSQQKIWLIVSETIIMMLMVVTVMGRLISGVHWFTDIMAGIILSVALVMLYYALTIRLKEKKAAKKMLSYIRV